MPVQVIARDVVFANDNIYVAHGHGGVLKVDVMHPSSASITDTYETDGFASGVYSIR
jgi:hypothetical protein